MSNKVYDILKYISLIFVPALMTFLGVVGSCLDFPYTDIVLTIGNAFGVFLGTLIGVSAKNYNKAGGK